MLLLRLAAARGCFCVAKKAPKPNGICWTRNEASGENLRNLLRSAVSAHHASEGKIPLCLFTNVGKSTLAAEGQARYGNASRNLFDEVQQDSLAAYVPSTAAAALHLWPTTCAHYVIRSRVGRLLNLARAPYEMTLFVDDDTYFCAPRGDDGLRGAIAWLYARRHRHTLRAQVFGHSEGGQSCVWDAVLDKTESFSAALEGECDDR
jgi:hypothetical protein